MCHGKDGVLIRKEMDNLLLKFGIRNQFFIRITQDCKFKCQSQFSASITWRSSLQMPLHFNFECDMKFKKNIFLHALDFYFKFKMKKCVAFPQEDFLFIKCFWLNLLNKCKKDFQFHLKTPFYTLVFELSWLPVVFQTTSSLLFQDQHKTSDQVTWLFHD
jgi:hypothetical protein